MSKHRQPATEHYQKLITTLLFVIIGALGTIGTLMMDIKEEMGGMREAITSVVKRVDRLESIHFDRQPTRDPRVIPPVEVIPHDRRKLRLEEGR